MNMKLSLRKGLVIGAAAAIVIVGSGITVHALTSNTPAPKKSVASVQSTTETETPATTAPVDTTATQAPQQAETTPVTPAAPTPDENKAKIMGVITDYVNSTYGQGAVYQSTTCFDRAFTSANLYGDYDSLVNFPLLKQFLAGQVVFGAPGLCGINVRSSQP